MITYTNSLDFCPGGVPLFVRLSQYDSNFSLVFNCFSHKGDFTVENGSTAVFREHKPDGNVISIDATVSGTTVTLTPSADNAKQMTAIKGHCECEISLQKNGKELSSANFVLLVEKAPVDIDAVQSDSVVRELYDVTDRAEEILEAAQTVDEAISDLPNLIDSTLTLPNHAADAKKTGDEITGLKSSIDEIEQGLSAEAKAALLTCFRNVAWINGQGQTYYDALETALHANDYPRLDVVYTAGITPVYVDDSFDTVKQYLTVTYYAEQGSAGVVVPSADYVLTGTLQVGTSTLTASYSGARASVIIPNVVDYYNVWEWSTPATLQIKAVVPGLYNNTCGYAVNSVDIRRSAWGYRGLHGVYNNNAGAVDNTTYPIPIPQGATKMVIACSNISNLYAGVSQWKYNPSTGVYTRNVNGAWTAIAGTEFAINRTASDFATIGFKISSGSGEVFPSDPVVTVTFYE